MANLNLINPTSNQSPYSPNPLLSPREITPWLLIPLAKCTIVNPSRQYKPLYNHSCKDLCSVTDFEHARKKTPGAVMISDATLLNEQMQCDQFFGFN